MKDKDKNNKARMPSAMSTSSSKFGGERMIRKRTDTDDVSPYCWSILNIIESSIGLLITCESVDPTPVDEQLLCFN